MDEKLPEKYENPRAKDLPIHDCRDRPGMDVACASASMMQAMHDLSGMTPDEISRNMQLVDKNGVHRDINPDEAQKIHDIIHQTERARRTFTMTEVEHERAKDFAKEHEKCYTRSAMGEKFEYVFLPGGIGTCVTIRCVICGKEKNITDYDCW